MKHTVLSLVAVVLSLSLGTLAQADKTIMITKKSDTMAKVSCAPGKGSPSVVPIKFADGADWTTVKDTYNVSDSTASSLMAGKEYVSIGSDGTAGFHSRNWLKMKKMVTGKE